MHFSTISKIVGSSLLFAAAAFAAPVNAETTDLGTLVPGTEYSWDEYITVTGLYTPSATGPVKFVYTNTPLALYTSADHNDDSHVYGDFSYMDGGQVISYPELQAGTTYYLYSPFTWTPGTLVIYEGSSELKVISTMPSTDPGSPEYYGGQLSASRTYEVLVNFNFPVTIGNCFVVAPDNTRVAISGKSGGTSVGCDVAPGMMQLYADGKLKDGDEMTLLILQVKDASDPDNKFNGNGRCEIPFKVAAKPLELQEVVGAKLGSASNIFNSFYLPYDENGLIKFIFDGDLSADNLSEARIDYGNSDNIEVGVYHETIKGTHDGGTVTFDFSGVRRRPIDMLPSSDSSTQPDVLYISFGNMTSPDGQRVYTGSKSNPTGYGMSFNLNVLQYTVVGDFTPARGTNLVAGQPMEIWVMNGDKIMFDNVRFEYVSDGKDTCFDIPENEVKAEADPFSEGAMLYTFSIPELNCDPDTNVIVTLSNLMCADGLDHSDDVKGEFKYSDSGVEDINLSVSNNYDVYDITGVKVLKNADRSALAGLSKGIYIVNGKKFVVK